MKIVPWRLAVGDYGVVVVREICTLTRLPYMDMYPVAVPLNAHASIVQIYIQCIRMHVHVVVMI